MELFEVNFKFDPKGYGWSNCPTLSADFPGVSYLIHETKKSGMDSVSFAASIYTGFDPFESEPTKEIRTDDFGEVTKFFAENGISFNKESEAVKGFLEIARN